MREYKYLQIYNYDPLLFDFDKFATNRHLCSQESPEMFCFKMIMIFDQFPNLILTVASGPSSILHELHGFQLGTGGHHEIVLPGFISLASKRFFFESGMRETGLSESYFN